MKYITSILNKENGKLRLEDIYTPAISSCELSFLRIITGNFKPDSISVSFISDIESRSIPMKEVYPTVFQVAIKENDLSGILKDNVKEFKIRLQVREKGSTSFIESEPIIRVLGLSLGKESMNDISNIYRILGNLQDRLND